uniref:Uncharacterized protein n=1 Tax=Ciona savignyi TaxID=51511 RepID=H2Y6T3_CIOSA
MASCVTACDGRMNESTLLRCLETIKQLKSKNEKLNHENQTLQEQLVTVTQKINDVRSGEATLSFHQNQPITTPTAENETLMELTKVNQALQEKLQANNVDMSDFMDKEEHNMLMEGYRKKIQILKQENKTLRENSSCEQMATKMSRLSTLLEKCCAVNQSYAEKIEKLQKDLSSLAAEVPPCVKMDEATTKAHAASNDYDFPHGNRTASGENVQHPEEEVKSPGQRSSSESSSEMNLR